MSLKSNVAAGKASRPLTELIVEQYHQLEPDARQRFIDNIIASILHLSSGNLRDGEPVDQEGRPLTVPMTDTEASRFEDRFMPFGIYQGAYISKVSKDDLKYLVWLADQQDNFKRDLRSFLLSPRILKERNELGL